MLLFFFSFLSINSGFWRLRRDSRSWSWGGRRRRWAQCVTMTSSVPSLSCAHISLCVCVCVQVTALRRQVRPTSGKVIRKVNLSEQTVQDSTHRPPSGRMYPSGSAAPNGNRWVFVQFCYKRSRSQIWSNLLSKNINLSKRYFLTW